MSNKSVKKVEKIENTNAVIITEETDDIDVLNRKAFIEQISKTIKYYSEHKEKVSFSIQGTWGSGKSWVINKLTNELYDIQDFDNSGLKYCIFSYNAWDYDYYDEPLISLFISLYKQLNNENAIFIKNENTRRKVKAFLDTIKDDFIEELKIVPFIGNIINFKQSFDEKLEQYDENIRKYDYHFDINQIMESTINGLKKISENNKTLILFVDELDRCLPEYAIKVLERIHHIKQNVSNIQIVYSVDKEQLSEIVNRIYGNKNKVNDYLAKFIDFGFSIPENSFNANFSLKYNQLFQQFESVNSGTIDITKLLLQVLPSITIRNQEKIINKLILTNNTINTSNKKLDNSILVVECFMALIEYYDIDWSSCFYEYDEKSKTIILDYGENQDVNWDIKQFFNHMKDVKNICKKNEYDQWMIDTSKKRNKVKVLFIYFIGRLLHQGEFHSTEIANDFLKNSEKYLYDFWEYYKLLKI